MGLFHKHKWRLISAVDIYDRYHSAYFPYSEVKDCITRVVLKCDECSKLNHEKFSGHIAEDLKKNYEVK